MYGREQDLKVKVALAGRDIDESAARFTGQESEGDGEDEPFVVAGGTFGDVGGDNPPTWSEPGQEEAQGCGLRGTSCRAMTSNRDDTSAMDATASQSRLGGVVGFCRPFRGDASERAHIPGPDEQVGVRPGRDLRVQGFGPGVQR
ncbi:MAG: hypothetical protein JWO93_1390 [Micrococcaceae bacterium]|nr:hypothetical protein [Micrococcaceae bacterium]